MNKYLSTCVLICVAPGAFAELGSGFYASVGVGAGIVTAQQLTSFELDYKNLYTDFGADSNLLSEAVNSAFLNTAQYEDSNESVVAGRAAIGYLWDIFEGKPTKFGNSIFTFNATLGLEFGYRLFDNATSSLTEVEIDDINQPCQDIACQVFEEANSKQKLQAFDLLAVARLPFTEDNKLALLLKGGVAYNMYELETSINVELDNNVPPPNYDNTYTIDPQKYDEFLPVLGAGLEYMFYEYVGLSLEYNAIFASSHDADSQLISGNLVFRF